MATTVDPDRLGAWTHGRQHLGDAEGDPLAVLRDVPGVYSAHPSAPLSIAARVPGLTRESFAALETSRHAVRVVGMRGSGFLAPLDLADDMVAAFRQDPASQPGQLRARGLDEATYADLRPRVLEAAREPITPTGLRRALGAADDDERQYFTVRLLAREGLILRVGTGRVRTDDLRWVATDAWLGRPLGDADPDAALRRIAAAYLRGYGPARVADFAWWAGVTRRLATAAIAGIDTVDVGDGLLLPADLASEWESARPFDASAIDVLPKWDPYTMGFAPDGRARLVPDALLRRAYSTADTRIGATSGDGLPLLLRGGRAVATWSHRLAGARMTVSVSPFDATGHAARRLVEDARAAFDAIGLLFEAGVEVALAGD